MINISERQWLWVCVDDDDVEVFSGPKGEDISKWIRFSNSNSDDGDVQRITLQTEGPGRSKILEMKASTIREEVNSMSK